MPRTKDRYTKRLAALKSERSSWDSHWQELADYLFPRRQRFYSSDRNKGTKRNEKIVNNTGTRALRIMASGMMAGITSPARDWFRLIMTDPELMEFDDVRIWLEEVERRMKEVFARSNIYNALPMIYLDLGAFGTSAMYVEEDALDVIRAYVFPVGTYCLICDQRERVTGIYRETTMTVEQLVEAFEWDRISNSTKGQWRDKQYDRAVDVIHVIEKNQERESERDDYRNMPWYSCWMEKGGDAPDVLLHEGGFHEFPMMAPRWMRTGEDIYGESPGMHALGDIKALQHLEKRKAQVMDKLVNPPMAAPTALRKRKVSILPGDTTYVSAMAGGQKFEPAHLVDPRALAITELIGQHEFRINSTFFADLFLMLANTDRRQITAREVEERHEEKLLQLGPVLESLQDEMLDPLIERTFNIMSRNGMIPPPPSQIEGKDWKVEYISIMAQRQKYLGTVAVERFAAFVSELAQFNPEVLDKMDFDQVAEQYAELLGVSPKMIRGDDEVESLRAQRQQQAQQAQMAEAAQAAQSGAGAAKQLSETKLDDDSALNRLLDAAGGV